MSRKTLALIIAGIAVFVLLVVLTIANLLGRAGGDKEAANDPAPSRPAPTESAEPQEPSGGGSIKALPETDDPLELAAAAVTFLHTVDYGKHQPSDYLTVIEKHMRAGADADDAESLDAWLIVIEEQFYDGWDLLADMNQTTSFEVNRVYEPESGKRFLAENGAPAGAKFVTVEGRKTAVYDAADGSNTRVDETFDQTLTVGIACETGRNVCRFVGPHHEVFDDD